MTQKQLKRKKVLMKFNVTLLTYLKLNQIRLMLSQKAIRDFGSAEICQCSVVSMVTSLIFQNCSNVMEFHYRIPKVGENLLHNGILVIKVNSITLPDTTEFAYITRIPSTDVIDLCYVTQILLYYQNFITLWEFCYTMELN